LADVVTPQKRSEMMSGIRGKDTKLEILVRSGLFRRGFRFRLHDSTVPGKPDIVLPKYRAVILLHGCFWHGHGCSLFKWPSSRADFWKSKIEGNRRHDVEILTRLNTLGWRVLVVWECATKGTGKWPVDNLLDTIADWVIHGKAYSELGCVAC